MARRIEVRPSTLPRSGELLKHVVEAFELRGRVPEGCSCMLEDRTTRDFFRGAPITHWCCRVTSVAHALVGLGILPRSNALAADSADASFLLFVWLGVAANWWDRHVVVHAPRDAAPALLRLAVVDLSSRAATIAHAAGLPEPPTTTPSWAQPGGGGAMLREMRDSLTPRPTFDEIARELRVSRSNLFEAWKGKHRPTEYLLKRLARFFAARLPGTNDRELLERFERHVALASLCRRAADAFGWPFVEDLASTFVRLTACSMRSLSSARPVAAESCAAKFIAMLGVFAGGGPHLVEHVTRHAPDWQQSIVEALGHIGLHSLPASEGESTRHAPALADFFDHLPRVKAGPPHHLPTSI